MYTLYKWEIWCSDTKIDRIGARRPKQFNPGGKMTRGAGSELGKGGG